ncbi:MAG: sulfatase [Streptosporangiales bacterium]|nr:sulfatase [Streptosporangiales bacterium]
MDVNESPGPEAPEVAHGRDRIRTGAAWALTALAFLVVWLALVGPNQLDRVTPAAFLRIPVEGLVLVAICLCLPARARRIVAVTVGLLLGLLSIVKLFDLPFYYWLDRPFSPVTDWGNLKPAIRLLRDLAGDKIVAAEIVSLLLLLAILVLLPLALVRLTRLTSRHRTGSARAVAVLGMVWIMCLAFNVQLDDGGPVASRSATTLAYDHVGAVHADLRDPRVFESALAAPDPLARTPRADLLSELRGKDVLVVFVESYGEVAIRGSSYSPQINSVLESGTRGLNSAGFSSRSALLTSPTFSGVSWLAHATLQSGLWVDNQDRYDRLVDSNRFTLSDAFKDAGWRTVGDVPANNRPWPEGKSFYNYDKLYNSLNVGYVGPKFGYAPVPDQYSLAAFQRMELAKQDRKPVMAEIDLVSSHAPWTPLPHMVGWNQVGDGSIYDGMPQQGQSPSVVWRDSQKVKNAYGQSIQYSLRSLFSFVQNSHNEDLVLVVLGDHQPGTMVSGSDANRRVPISIIAHDPKVMDQISSWGWQDGMQPDSHAPVWPMDAFRDRFLTAYCR